MWCVKSLAWACISAAFDTSNLELYKGMFAENSNIRLRDSLDQLKVYLSIKISAETQKKTSGSIIFIQL
jgi:hypothetical protein